MAKYFGTCICYFHYLFLYYIACSVFYSLFFAIFLLLMFWTIKVTTLCHLTRLLVLFTHINILVNVAIERTPTGSPQGFLKLDNTLTPFCLYDRFIFNWVCCNLYFTQGFCVHINLPINWLLWRNVVQCTIGIPLWLITK